MELITVILIVIALIYAFFILQLILGFSKIKSFEPKASLPKNAFTIIVPFRNEEKNLPKLLESFSNLDYPHELIEIIMVDDFSKDKSERVYINWRMKNDTIDTTLLENLKTTNSPKKDAINRVMPIAKHNWIITTDADCVVNKNWLSVIDNYIQNQNVEMIVGSVIYKTKNNWFHHFQQLDMLSLQATTIGSFGIGKPFMCNGANFIYTKKLFHELDGFSGNATIASGDDVFLLQKAVEKFPEKVHYLKNTDTIVKTKPENDLYKFFMQRVRWAAKTTRYKSSYAKSLAIVVLLMNMSLVIGLSLVVYGCLNWEILFGIFLIKYSIDYILLIKANEYLTEKKFLLPMASSLLYPFYSTLTGVYSIFAGYSWKGRRYKM
jgi:cellulose synthase/poly-beta-1,6-N-acetylglucosamine synthase-like glycosyltransferase